MTDGLYPGYRPSKYYIDISLKLGYLILYKPNAELDAFLFQIAFRKETVISRIATWARKTKTTQWVTKYTIQYSEDTINWFAYRENGLEKVFTVVLFCIQCSMADNRI